ncbi:MAG TPA: prepilin-type N-terminal cleavage/methylation domain-containing protein [Gemmatimonadaceae bacterium]|jgi:prepilin-type N-terminal cleavage/methylation domain-containing protein|nr:prepilin-type N-terminal cleavage/methylation domain-containing protein [Gemmatimonadaceae bacterium]
MRIERSGAGKRTRARGFTVIEVLVALVVLAAGLLTLAGSAALAIRSSAAATRERRAVQRGADRIALLRAAGCAAARSGAATDATARIAERWTVGSPAGGALFVDEEVRWVTPAGWRTVLLRGAILC